MHDFILIGRGGSGAGHSSGTAASFFGLVRVLEKESAPARHQGGHNYRPGSLKARLGKEGNRATRALCREHRIRFDEAGKLLAASPSVLRQITSRLRYCCTFCAAPFNWLACRECANGNSQACVLTD